MAPQRFLKSSPRPRYREKCLIHLPLAKDHFRFLSPGIEFYKFLQRRHLYEDKFRNCSLYSWFRPYMFALGVNASDLGPSSLCFTGLSVFYGPCSKCAKRSGYLFESLLVNHNLPPYVHVGTILHKKTKLVKNDKERIKLFGTTTMLKAKAL